MARRLATLAQHINDNWPGYTAEVRRVHVSTDIKVNRLRIPKKGRWGNELTVTEDATGVVVFRHNAAEQLRANDEVEEWIRTVEAAECGTSDKLRYLPGDEEKRLGILRNRAQSLRQRMSQMDGLQKGWNQHQLEQYGQEMREIRERMGDT